MEPAPEKQMQGLIVESIFMNIAAATPSTEIVNVLAEMFHTLNS